MANLSHVVHLIFILLKKWARNPSLQNATQAERYQAEPLYCVALIDFEDSNL